MDQLAESLTIDPTSTREEEGQESSIESESESAAATKIQSRVRRFLITTKSPIDCDLHPVGESTILNCIQCIRILLKSANKGEQIGEHLHRLLTLLKNRDKTQIKAAVGNLVTSYSYTLNEKRERVFNRNDSYQTKITDSFMELLELFKIDSSSDDENLYKTLELTARGELPIHPNILFALSRISLAKHTIIADTSYGFSQKWKQETAPKESTFIDILTYKKFTDDLLPSVGPLFRHYKYDMSSAKFRAARITGVKNLLRAAGIKIIMPQSSLFIDFLGIPGNIQYLKNNLNSWFNPNSLGPGPPMGGGKIHRKLKKRLGKRKNKRSKKTKQTTGRKKSKQKRKH